MAFKLNMREVLDHLDTRDFSYYEGLTDDQKKGFTGLIAMRFLSSVPNHPCPELFLFTVNETANVHFHDIYDHPELQYKLLAACGAGYEMNHPWIPMAKTSARRTEVHELLQELHPSANDFELEILFEHLDRETLAGLIADCALPSDRKKTLLNAFDKASAKRS